MSVFFFCKNNKKLTELRMSMNGSNLLLETRCIDSQQTYWVTANVRKQNHLKNTNSSKGWKGVVWGWYFSTFLISCTILMKAYEHRYQRILGKSSIVSVTIHAATQLKQESTVASYTHGKEDEPMITYLGRDNNISAQCSKQIICRYAIIKKKLHANGKLHKLLFSSS